MFPCTARRSRKHVFCTQPWVWSAMPCCKATRKGRDPTTSSRSGDQTRKAYEFEGSPGRHATPEITCAGFKHPVRLRCMLGVSSVDVWTMNISISVHWRLKFGPSMNPYIKSSLFKPPHPLQACTENLPNMESHLLYICKTTNFRPNLCLNYRILAVRVQKRHLYQVPLFMGS